MALCSTKVFLKTTVAQMSRMRSYHNSLNIKNVVGSFSGRLVSLHHQSSRSMVGWLQKSNSRSLVENVGKPCSWNTCCAVHTENDKNLLDFLKEEIKMENENKKKQLPKIKDFIISSDECEVALKKTSGNEKITVKFNVNHSVNSGEVAADDQSNEMVSRPPFTVEIEKGGVTLALSCVFTEDISDPQSGTQYADTLEIEEVCLHHGDWKDKSYTVPASIMDGNLYDHLLNVLEDRGIDEAFVEQLIEFSTTYEQNKYISFLAELQDFVKK